MPLFYQHNINEYTRLGIWLIAEPESFFLQKVPLKRDVSHPHKRLQHLAGRFLLTVLFDDFPLEEVMIADTRKPYLPGEKYHFSISHCQQFAAAIVSSRSRVGIDVELVKPVLENIRHKFLSADEYGLAMKDWKPAHDTLILLTMLWSAKEAIYKWFSLGQVNFINAIQLISPLTAIHDDEWQLSFLFAKKENKNLAVKCKRFDDLLMCYLLT